MIFLFAPFVHRWRSASIRYGLIASHSIYTRHRLLHGCWTLVHRHSSRRSLPDKAAYPRATVAAHSFRANWHVCHWVAGELASGLSDRLLGPAPRGASLRDASAGKLLNFRSVLAAGLWKGRGEVEMKWCALLLFGTGSISATENGNASGGRGRSNATSKRTRVSYPQIEALLVQGRRDPCP